MIEQYKIFENLQQAKKYLADHNIPETDPKFVTLKALLKNNLGYMGTFTEWMYKDREDFDNINDVYTKLKKTNNLDKQIDEFEKMEDLYDYLQNFETKRIVDKTINGLPSHTKKYVSDELRNLISLNVEWADLVRKFYTNKGGRYNEHSRFWTLPKKFKTYEEWLLDETKIYIQNLKGEWNLKTILKKIDESDLVEGVDFDMVERTPELLMLRIYTYKASKQIGARQWCIVTSESMFKHYVTDFANQYFVWDFTKDISDVRHMIGTTVSPGGKITSGHWADDSSIRDLAVLDAL